MGSSTTQQVNQRSPQDWGSQTIGTPLTDCVSRLATANCSFFASGESPLGNWPTK